MARNRPYHGSFLHSLPSALESLFSQLSRSQKPSASSTLPLADGQASADTQRARNSSMEIKEKLSPWRSSRGGAKPDTIIIHGTEGSDSGDLDWMTNPAHNAKVSYHYLIQRRGAIWRLVPEAEKAWHAGVSSWEGRDNMNVTSIGIGLSNLGLKGKGEDDFAVEEHFTEEQYRACGVLCRVIAGRHNIPMSRIIGHYHVSPGRKKDPYYHFNWGKMFNYMNL